MFKKILVPLDGSEHSRKIIRWATGLASALRAEVVLVSVVDPEEIEILEATISEVFDSERGGTTTQMAHSPVDIINEAIGQAEKTLREEAKKIEAAGVTSSARVVSGPPAEMIVAEAHALEVDMIAMATRRESALVRGVLGSVTDRVLHSTSIPILTLSPGDIGDSDDFELTPSRIIVPLDGSQLSESVVAQANELAKATGAELVFTEVLRLPFFGVGVAGMEYGSGDYAGDFAVDAQKVEITSYLNDFVEEAEKAGIEASASVRTGSPARQIVEEATESENSMVVMGSHGAGGLKRWVIGSVADKVVRSARRPVLVIPPKTG